MNFLRNITLSAIAFSSASILAANDWEDAIDGIQAQVIQPRYTALAHSALQLNESASQLCNTPSEQNLAQLKNDFEKNVQDWQAIQWLNLGPVTYFMRYYAMEYWPDVKGIARRQLRSLSSDPSVMEEAGFWNSASIAVRGITAIENLIYHPDFNVQTNAEHCHVLSSVAAHHAETTADLTNQWQQSSVTDWVFGDEDDSTPLPTLAMETFIQQWLEHLSVVKDTKIETPIGYKERANLKLLEFYRSGQSLPSIKANLAQYAVLYHAGSPSLFDQGKAHSPQLATELDEALVKMNQIADAMPEDLFSKRYSQAQRVEMMTPLIQAISLSQTRLMSLVTSMGFQIGFNSRDGD